MRSVMAMVALAALVAPAIAMDEGTFQVKVTVSGMSWPNSWGSQVKSGLGGLEGFKSVKQVSFEDGVGVYSVTLDEKKSVTVKALGDAVNPYKLDRADLTIVGEIEKNDKGLWLTARGSSAKFSLKNREKKEGEKEAPDVMSKLEGFLKDGSKLVKIEACLKAEKDTQVLNLESAEIVKK